MGSLLMGHLNSKKDFEKVLDVLKKEAALVKNVIEEYEHYLSIDIEYILAELQGIRKIIT